jgi:hypothetical protein
VVRSEFWNYGETFSSLILHKSEGQVLRSFAQNSWFLLLLQGCAEVPFKGEEEDDGEGTLNPHFGLSPTSNGVLIDHLDQ